LKWPQDLDGEVLFVEFYVVNDYSQVSIESAIVLNKIFGHLYIGG